MIKKIIQSFVTNENFLNENFRPEDRNSVAQIYEKLFKNILYNYKEKKNHMELPFYLNYLVLKSNIALERFFCQKVVERENYEGEKTSYEIINYICKNFEKLFVKYTNYGNETLSKLQLIHFYSIQLPQAKVASKYQTIYEVLDAQEMRFTRENKVINGHLEFPDHEKRYINPFMTRLNQACDIYPNKENKVEILKSI